MEELTVGAAAVSGAAAASVFRDRLADDGASSAADGEAAAADGAEKPAKAEKPMKPAVDGVAPLHRQEVRAEKGLS